MHHEEGEEATLYIVGHGDVMGNYVDDGSRFTFRIFDEYGEATNMFLDMRGETDG